MSVTTNHPDGSSELVINIRGRFDFSSHQAFKEAYENANEQVESYLVNMAEATYLDSSALGMLLLLRDYAGGDKAKVSITNCNNDVRKILSIANFEQLFNIK